MRAARRDQVISYETKPLNSSGFGFDLLLTFRRPFEGYRSSDSDIDDDELENLLNEGLPDDLRDKKKDTQYEERFKVVLEGK